MEKRIAMLVFSYYPADPRPRREAEALVHEGISVDMICLKGDYELNQEVINGVHVYRLPVKRKRGGKLSYLLEYACFIMMSFFTLSMLYMRKRYKIIHVHNMPDILVFSALLPRLCGSKIVLDLHDPMPEVYMAKYFISDKHPIIRLLCLIEKYSVWFSDLVLTPNIAFRDLFISRGCLEEKIHIVMNSPDEAIFCGKNANKNKNETLNHKQFVLMYHGTIVERNGLDTALYAISHLRDKIPNLVFHVYGKGDFVKRFLEIVDELNLRQIVNYYGFIHLESIARAIEDIDIGLIPNKRNSFTEINMPTRIFEYLCMGKPVIAPKTKGIVDYFSEDSLNFFEPGSVANLSEVVLDVYRKPSHSRAVLDKGMANYHMHRWELQKHHFVDLMKELLQKDVYRLKKVSYKKAI
jgi:glycosyltransferase involved in cell wall biosynthesis